MEYGRCAHCDALILVGQKVWVLAIATVVMAQAEMGIGAPYEPTEGDDGIPMAYCREKCMIAGAKARR